MNPRSNGRGPTFGANGMVASSQTMATQIGVEILRAGGSAVDAAIATNAALSVIEPHMCGLGGDLFAIVWDPQEQALAGLNASGRSASSLSLEHLTPSLSDEFMPMRGPLPITIPGAVDGWCMLHDRYGKLNLADVLKPAVVLANHGTPIGKRTAAAWAEATSDLEADLMLKGRLDPFHAVYTNEGKTPNAGQVFRNECLALTLKAVGEGGSAEFYEGAIAEQLVTYLSQVGSSISADDLATAHANWVAPVSTTYRGYEVFELPPNGQGMTVLQMLNILEAYPLGEWGRENVEYWHCFLEAKKLSFEDRARHYADPESYAAPIDNLLSKRYAADRAQLIDPSRAGKSYVAGQMPGSDTTYLSAADNDGLMVSLIQSIFSPFGSGLVPPSLGFALQSRGAGFSLDPAHPNCYAPGKRPFHTIIPGFVCKAGKPWFSFGVMGADMQPQGQVQVLNNLIDFGFDPQAAGDAPRMRHDGGSSPNGPLNDASDGIGVTQYEVGFGAELISGLKALGHNMVPQKPGVAGFAGGYQGIMRDDEHGTYAGASESRLDGAALGI